MNRHISIALLAALSALSSACGSDGPPSTSSTANNAAPQKVAPDPSVAGHPGAPAKPLATTTTNWPTIEARLSSVRRRTGLAVIEVQLVNTGSSPVTIDHYSAAAAQMTDDASKRIYDVFAPPGGQPAATTDLTQTLAPGESTTVNAAFPLPSTAEILTIVLPNIGRFEGIPLRQLNTGATPGASTDDKRAQEKADNRARAMSAGREKKKTP